jgi:hypothetical protein
VSHGTNAVVLSGQRRGKVEERRLSLVEGVGPNHDAELARLIVYEP